MKRRDRHGRGIRGPLLPSNVPRFRTRAQRFDDLVVASAAPLEKAWGQELAGAEFAVEETPLSEPAPWEQAAVPLGRCFPADAGQAARIVLYRMPIQMRAATPQDVAQLVHDVLVEQVAQLVSRSPEEIAAALEY